MTSELLTGILQFKQGAPLELDAAKMCSSLSFDFSRRNFPSCRSAVRYPVPKFLQRRADDQSNDGKPNFGFDAEDIHVKAGYAMITSSFGRYVGPSRVGSLQ